MRPAIVLAILAGFSLPTLRAQEPVSLERSLVRAAPAIVKELQAKGYKTVGVLKFLVHRVGQDKFTDNAGTLNRTVARRLEVALVLANPPKDPLNIIDNASDIAAQTAGANHLTKEGRLKLFEPRYPLAWGKEKLAADAFVTGIVSIGADLKRLTIKFVVFDKATNSLQPIGTEVVALNDPRKLTEIGESFSRGAFDDGNVEPSKGPAAQEALAKKEEQTLDTASQVKSQGATNPAVDPNAPVKLEILIDGRPVSVEVKDGKAFIPEPTEGQKVSFRMRRNAGQGTFACVLKVNGENTLFREKSPDLHCRKWLLFPEDMAGIEVVGYQKTDDLTEQFRVLSKQESKAREMDYGTDVGTITLTVFRDLKGKAPRSDQSDETQSTKVVEKAKLPEQKPDNFYALTAQLLEDANRGLIAQGATVEKGITVVKDFVADPTPVMSLTVVYYKK